MDLQEMYNAIIDNNIATEKELDLVCDVAGYNEETFDDVVYSRTGYQTLEDYLEDKGGDE